MGITGLHKNGSWWWSYDYFILLLWWLDRFPLVVCAAQTQRQKDYLPQRTCILSAPPSPTSKDSLTAFCSSWLSLNIVAMQDPCGMFWLTITLGGVPFLQFKDRAGVLIRSNWLVFTQYFKYSKIWTNFHLVHPQDIRTDHACGALWIFCGILSCVLDIIMRRYGRHAGNYNWNGGHMVAVACRLPAFYQQYPAASSVVPSHSSFWVMQVSRLSLNECDLFWWVVTGVAVGFSSGKGIKTVNTHKNKVLLWGAIWRAVSFWPHDACTKLHNPGSLQQGIRTAYRCWRALWVWCTNGAILNTTMWPWGSGTRSSKVLVIAQPWEPKGRSPLEARQRCGRDSSPRLIIVGVPSIPHKTDTETENKA